MTNPLKFLEYFMSVELVVFVLLAIVAGVRLRAISSKLISYLKTQYPDRDTWHISLPADGQIAQLVRFFKYVYSDADNEDSAILQHKLRVRNAAKFMLIMLLITVGAIVGLCTTKFLIATGQGVNFH